MNPVVVLFRVGVVVWIAGVVALGEPQARVAPERLEFGAVKSGEIVTRTVTLFNEGDAPLEVFKVQASCGCSRAELPEGKQVSVPVGGSIEIPVHFDPGNRSGRQNAVIAITTNDPRRPAVTVEVSAVIQALATVRPVNGLVWQQSPRGSEIRRTVVIAPGDPEHDIDVIEVTSDNPNLTLVANKVVRKSQRMIDLKFSIADTAPLGELAATVTARVRVNGEETTLSIPARGAVVGDVVVSPMEINTTQAGVAPGTRIGGLTVRGTTNDKAAEIRGVILDGALRVDVKPANGDQPDILVYASDDARGGPQSGSVYVVTTSADQPVVRVPVYFLVAPSVIASPEAVLIDASRESVRVELRATSAQPFSITAARSENDAVTVSTVSNAGEIPTIEIRRASDAAADRVETRVVVETSLDGAGPVNIPVVIQP